jgi:hypothetical protein
MPYFVTGGEYADTTFTRLVRPEPTFGPFDSHEEARVRWRERAFATIDCPLIRFRIVRAEHVEAVATP